MTNAIHDVVVKVDVYPDEFKPIMKAVKYALMCDARDAILNEDEWAAVDGWLDYISDIAPNEAV